MWVNCRSLLPVWWGNVCENVRRMQDNNVGL